MRVNDRNTTETPASQTGRAQETQKPDRGGTTTPAASGDSGGDRVELSSTLGRLSQAISSFSAQRASRVQALTADYQTGRLQADSGATSRGVVSEALAAGRG
jgi:anti-sigma28 factor (negative regulator of flagellin synthesis)